ncbi:hypothetical protein [Brevibacillus borstelensis]|uniref:hypothetical protein n=1 Tax=Brevibacillus borstelensis TaxID=45462 RepID=UPI0030BF307C
METAIEKALGVMLENWDRLKKSQVDDAEEDANQFEASFYVLIEQIRAWFTRLEETPQSLDDAVLLPEMEKIVQRLPGELILNFETELELIVDGETRVEDEKYD